MKKNKPFRGLTAAPRADTSDSVALIAQFNTAFEEFKAANDERLIGVDKKFDDVVTNDKVDAINATLTELQDAINMAVEKQAQADLAGGSDDGINFVKAAKEFSITAGLETPIDADTYKSYHENLDVYMRKGENHRGVMAAMEVGSDPAGGYTVTPDMSGKIVTKVYETSSMRQYANIETINTDKLEGFNDLGEGSQGWVGEKQARVETDTPELGKWLIEVHEQYAEPRVTQKLLDDSSVDIAGWLASKTSDKFAREENTRFVTGNGILKPRGFLDHTTALTDDDTRAWEIFQHVISGSTSAVNNNDFLISLVFKLKAHFRTNANWFMNRATLASIRKLKDGDGNYLWQPDFTQRQGGNLLGYGIAEFEDMPDMASNSLSIAFGDMRQAYTIVDRTGIRVIRDNLTAKPYIKFYTTKRVGGDVTNFEAMKFMKFTT